MKTKLDRAEYERRKNETVLKNINAIYALYAKVTSEATAAAVAKPRSSMSDILFFERLTEQVRDDIGNISRSCEPVGRVPQDPMVAARILSKGYFHG